MRKPLKISKSFQPEKSCVIHTRVFVLLNLMDLVATVLFFLLSEGGRDGRNCYKIQKDFHPKGFLVQQAWFNKTIMLCHGMNAVFRTPHYMIMTT